MGVVWRICGALLLAACLAGVGTAQLKAGEDGAGGATSIASSPAAETATAVAEEARREAEKARRIARAAREAAELVEAQNQYVRSSLPAFLIPVATAQLFGYPVWRLVAALGVILLAMVLKTLLAHLLRRLVERAGARPGTTEATVETATREALGARDGVRVFFLRALRIPMQILLAGGAVALLGPILLVHETAVTNWAAEVLLNVAVVVFAYQIVDALEVVLRKYTAKTETPLDDMLLPLVKKALRIAIVIIAALHLYQIAFHQELTTLIAGLGIGGIALALAAKDTLSDIFGFVMIVLDQPFLVGDRLVVDGHDGPVESVGFFSTRIRRLDGHLVSIPNSTIANTTIHNIGKRPYIRRIMNVGVTYDTPPEKVEAAVEILRDILKDHEGMDPEFPPRVYFNEFNAANLNIIAIYWYHPPEYWDYLDHAQRLNLELMRRYAAEGIEFAFPTQTLYLAGDPNRELALRLAEGGSPPPAPPDGTSSS